MQTTTTRAGHVERDASANHHHLGRRAYDGDRPAFRSRIAHEEAVLDANLTACCCSDRAVQVALEMAASDIDSAADAMQRPGALDVSHDALPHH